MMLSAQNNIDRNTIVQALQERVRSLEQAHRTDYGIISTGVEALDRLLPSGGFRRGSLIEWFSTEGSGAVTLALLAANQACRAGGALFVVDCERTFYPPAAADLGVDLTNTIIVGPRNKRDRDWTLNQALSCSGVAAVLCWLNPLDSQMFRRLQLAAETGGSLGLLIRPLSAIRDPSWSDIQILVQPTPGQTSNRRLRIKPLRCRGGNTDKSVEVEMDHETGSVQSSHVVHLASELAHSTNSSSPPRA